MPSIKITLPVPEGQTEMHSVPMLLESSQGERNEDKRYHQKYQDKDSTETIVHSLVTARLDCNNVLLAGLPDIQVKRLQRLQNTAMRITTKTPKRMSVETARQGLHWLPDKRRIVYKILLYVFKAYL